MSEKKPHELRISSVPPFGLRMLPDLRAKIEKAAAENDRSLNAEIIARLESSFDTSDSKRIGISALYKLAEDLKSITSVLDYELEKERGYHSISEPEHEKIAAEANEAYARERNLTPASKP